MIAIDRKGGGGALRRLVRHARRVVAQGRPILMFPEGTRTAPGQTRRYHPGIYALYRELALPVVPVALNSGLYWPRRSYRQARRHYHGRVPARDRAGARSSTNSCGNWSRASSRRRML